MVDQWKDEQAEIDSDWEEYVKAFTVRFDLPVYDTKTTLPYVKRAVHFLLKQQRNDYQRIVEALRVAIADGQHGSSCPIVNYRTPCKCWKRQVVDALMVVEKHQ